MENSDKNPDDDFEIGDVENFSSQKDKKFSHQELVMRVLMKCMESGCKEPVEGGTKPQKDRNGNVVAVYLPDTRREYIACVENALCFMTRDFDEDAKSNIQKLKNSKKTLKNYFLDMEYNWWASLDFNSKQNLTKNGFGVTKGIFNIKNPFFNQYIDELLDVYREILTELNNLTLRKNDYESDTIIV